MKSLKISLKDAANLLNEASVVSVDHSLDDHILYPGFVEIENKPESVFLHLTLEFGIEKHAILFKEKDNKEIELFPFLSTIFLTDTKGDKRPITLLYPMGEKHIARILGTTIKKLKKDNNLEDFY